VGLLLLVAGFESPRPWVQPIVCTRSITLPKAQQFNEKRTNEAFVGLQIHK
jgi:hypothetical protein